MVDLNMFVIYLFTDIFLFSFPTATVLFILYVFMWFSLCAGHILHAYSQDTLHYISLYKFLSFRQLNKSNTASIPKEYFN